MSKNQTGIGWTRALLTAGMVCCSVATTAVAEGGSSPETSATSESYQLRHHLMPGQVLRYEVTHVAKTKTKMDKAEETSSMHTISVRAWEVGDSSESKMTFQHQIESVEMTQQNGDQEEVRWDSSSDEVPPAMFQAVADQMGSPLATVTINERGQEVHRESHGGTKANLGMGELVLAFPKEPVKIGGSWAVPTEIKARKEDGSIKPIKIRQLYTLEKVKVGVATIRIKSEALTPIDEESVRAQVVQQLNNGTLRFDLDNGYLLSKELNWDETVVGFRGAGSMMEYRARLNEKLIGGSSVQAAKAGRSVLSR
ncbi:MAG: DUF6263 family protein [Planctomycetota bacterium]